jgi:allophanate hydrolase
MRAPELAAERWLLSESALGSFLAELPEPMLLGSVRLTNGSTAVGFACDGVAAAKGTDITRYGDWLAAVAALEGTAGDHEPASGRLWRETGEALVRGLQRGRG